MAYAARMIPSDATVEEALRLVIERAAMLQYLMAAVDAVGAVPERSVINGMSDVCSDIEDLASRVKGALGVSALGTQLGKTLQR
jgi:hypothetical protein